MVTLLVAGVGAVAGAGATGTTAFLIATATAAAAMGAAYIDQRYIYPELFGVDQPRTPNDVFGIDQMTGEEGAPSHTCWGRAALVGGHVLWFENFEETSNRATTKKGPGDAQTRRRADVGIAWSHGRLLSMDRIFADQKPFWDRTPNLAQWVDYRVAITASAGNLIITATSNEVPDFDNLLDVDNVVVVAGVSSALNGYWRVVAITGAAVGASFPIIELSPLAGQTAASATGGSDVAPMSLTRIDVGIVDHTVGFSATGSTILNVSFRTDGTGASTYARDPLPLLLPGLTMRLENYSPSGVNGLYKIFSFTSSGGLHVLALQRTSGVVVAPAAQTATNPGRIVIEEPFGFLEFSQDQVLVSYAGTETEGADPDLAGVFGGGNVHGYRGVARSTIRKYNMSNFGDRVGSHSGVARASDAHTTHDPIRFLITEAFDGDGSRHDLTDLPADPLLGYTRRGPQPTSGALQPLAIAYGIECQEVGARFRFFKAETAHLHQLGEADFGATVGREMQQKFQHKRVPDRSLPKLVQFMYRDPTQEHTRRERTARAERLDIGTTSTDVVDVDPVALYPWDADRAVRRIFVQARVGRDQGTIVVPPSRLYILPNDRLTFTALNSHEEEIELDAGAIDFFTRLRPIEEGSITVEVTFETAGNCRMVDDTSGTNGLTGFPASVTGATSAIDYDTGHIEFSSDDPILKATIRYEFANAWRMRVQNVRRHANGLMTLELMAVAERFSKIGSPVTLNHPAFQPSRLIPNIRGELIDAPGINYTTSTTSRMGITYAACPRPGNVWNGAVAFSSTDNLNWQARGFIAQPTPMGTANDTLADGDASTWDWTVDLNVTMDYGEPEDASIDDVEAFRAGWVLVGSEILAYRTATLEIDGTYTLAGLLRGLRNTEEHMATHAADERVVFLAGLGEPSGSSITPVPNGLFEDFSSSTGGAQVLGTSSYFLVLPVGAVVTGQSGTLATAVGHHRRPFSVAAIQQGSIVDYGTEFDPADPGYDASKWLVEDIVVRWWRRSRNPLGQFGPTLGHPLWEHWERYRITVKRQGVVVDIRHVGDHIMGSTLLHPVFRYTLAEQTAAGFTGGEVAEIVIEQQGMLEYSPPVTITWNIP